MTDNVIYLNGDRDTRDMMSDAKFFEGYSRWNEDKNRYETWNEAVERVMSMHRQFYKDKMTDELVALMDEAEELYKQKYFLGAQRALQFGGEQLLKHQMRLYNCTSTYADRAVFFGEFFYVLLCGAGAGVSVQKHHVAKLPKIQNRTKQAKIFTPEDSIEGWADCADVLLSSYFVGGGKHTEYEGRRVYFDLSKIREKGALISGGFKAPGPEPLRRALDKIEHLLQGLVLKGVTQLSPIHVYDISMHLADAVLAGGVRRSATIFLFSPDDEEMMKAKTGNWFIENPQRGRSNNSALIVRSTADREQFHKLMESVREFGEPGFVFTESTEHTYNPCVEIGKYPVFIDDNGDKHSGWQGCVSYDTQLITKDGIETIGEAADAKRSIDVWNGTRWSTVKPIQTGAGRELFRVNFSDGSYLDCTDNHKFLGKAKRWDSQWTEYTTADIISLLDTEPYRRDQDAYKFEVPRANITDYNWNGKIEPKAYQYGWILGDGTCRYHTKKTPWGQVYESEWDMIPYLGDDVVVSDRSYQGRGPAKYKNVYFKNVNLEFAKGLKYDIGLPKELFGWDRESIKEFFYGWIDTDGSVSQNGFRIYGSDDKIRDAQLLLTKIGIVSTVCKYKEVGDATNKGTFRTALSYINVVDSKDMIGRYKKISGNPNNRKLFIRSIEKLDGLHNSYCFEEAELHQGVFNNVLTKQCNLTEINGSKSNTVEEFMRACRGAAILGTLQAGYTNFKFISDISKKIFDREALLGVSITGWMNNPQILLQPEILQKGATLVREVNRHVAKIIGINPAARTTCVKPAGNASVLLKTASGVHGEQAPLYIRNIQMNKDSEVAQLIKSINPYMVEESVWSQNKTDYVISFPVIAPSTSIWKSDLYGVNLLEKVKLIQHNWVEFGTDESLCVDHTVRHNVSNTIDVLPTQWEEVEEYLFENRYSFAGVSLLASSGDKDFAQAPFTAIETEEEIARKYGRGAMFASGLIVDGMKVFDDLWSAIMIANFGDNEANQEKADNRAEWIRRFDKYSKTYFNGDRKRAEYCLKAVYLLHKWAKIQENYKAVEFATQLESKKFTDIDTTAAASCLGVQGCAI